MSRRVFKSKNIRGKKTEFKIPEPPPISPEERRANLLRPDALFETYRNFTRDEGDAFTSNFQDFVNYASNEGKLNIQSSEEMKEYENFFENTQADIMNDTLGYTYPELEYLQKRNNVLMKGGYRRATVALIKASLNVGNITLKKIVLPLLDGDSYYLITANCILSIGLDERKQGVKHNMVFKAKPNLTGNQLRAIITYKLINYFSIPRNFESRLELIGFSFISYRLPNNFDIGNTRLFLPKPPKLHFLEQYSEDIEYKDNCVFEYLSLELSKIYKTFKKSNLNKQMLSINKDFREEGFTINDFKYLMARYYKNIQYLGIGADYKVKICMNERRDKNRSNLVFVIKDQHIYPITEIKMKEKILRNKDNLTFLMNNTGVFSGYNKWDDELKIKDTNYILPDTYDYEEYKNNLVKDTGYCIEYFTESFFKHPLEGVLIHKNNGYDDRKKTYESLNIGKWENQSYPAIAKELLLSLGSIPPSYYNKESWYELTNYQPVAIKDVLEVSDSNMGKDISKHYTDIFYNKFSDMKTPIYDCFNCIKPYNGEDIKLGEYFVKPFTYKKVKLGGYYIHYEVVKLLLNKKIITKKHITKCINTTRYYYGSNFKKFVDITKQFDEKIFKKLNNMLNGTLNNCYKKIKKENFHTRCLETLTYLATESINENYEFTHELYPDNYYLYRYKKTPNYSNTSSLYRQTISVSIGIMLKHIEYFEPYGIVKVNVDGIYIKNKFKSINNKCHFMDMIGKIKDEKGVIIEEVKRYEPKKEVKLSFKKPILMLGSGGNGKSYKVIQEADAKKNILLLTPTNASRYNLVEKAQKIKGSTIWTFMTVSFFIESNRNYSKAIATLNEYDKIIVDEVFMISTNMLRMLLVLNTDIILLGDEKQLPKFEEQQVEPYNLLEAKQLFILTEKKFEEGKSRYNRITYNIIDEFVKTSKIPNSIKRKTIKNNEINDNAFHIVTYNNTRKKITKIICNKLFNNGKKIIFNYQKKNEVYKIGVGCKIIATSNLFKGINIFNNWTGEISKITNDEITIKGIIGDEYKLDTFKMDIKQFRYNFIPYYASTVHKSQGCAIDKPYIIWDSHAEYGDNLGCNKNSLYTSLTRCKDINNIIIEGKTKEIYTYYNIKKKPIDMELPKYNYYIYEITYKCECKHKKKHDKYIHNTDNKINIECEHEAKLIKQGNMDSMAVKRYIYNYNKEVKIDLEKVRVKSFKPKLNGKKDKVVIHNDYIMYTYYIDGVSNRKRIRTKKISIEEALKDINGEYELIDKRKTN